MKINDYFDNIYLLNLHKRKSRLDESTTKLNSLGLKYDIFHGCDGYVIEHIWSKFNNPYFLNSRYLACSISHLSIYQDALENGHQKVLILEDDNIIHTEIQQIFDKFDNPEFEDLFYLGYIPLSDDLQMWTYEITYNSTTSINSNFFRCRNLWGLFAYGITSTLMEEILAVYKKDFPMELDRYFVNEIQPRGKSIGIVPQLFACGDNIFSDNTGSSEHLSTTSIDNRFANRNNYN